MANVRTVKEGKTTYYVVNDLLSAFNLTKGKAFKGIPSTTTGLKYANVPTKVGNATQGVRHTVVSASLAKRIAKNNKVTNTESVFGTVATSNVVAKQTKQVDRLTTAVTNLKVVVAQLLTKGNMAKNSLQLKGKSANVNNDPKQAEARKAVRKLVEAYAEKKADELNITDSKQRSIFYDVTYKTLYAEYKRLTPTHVDLKILAESKENKDKKVSALQVAEQLGLATELLQLARSIYKTS
jgi:hypothetical protein